MTVLPEIIGMPPMFDDNEGNINQLMIDTMPTAIIKPAYPEFKAGMSTMITNTQIGMGKYNNILNYHNFSLYSPQEGLKVAFLADSFPTDSFSNSYTEGFLQDIATGFSKKASTVIQTFGGRSAIGTGAKVANAGKDAFKDMGVVGSAISGALGATADTLNGVQNLIDSGKMTDNKSINSVLSNLSAMSGGARVDFPQIWSDSQFTPSYTMTIRLYNPDPSDPASTEKYIIGPVAALMLLGIPISDDKSGSTYNYPFLHDINAKGIYHLNPCYISNIAVIKGGDQQQIAYNQQMGIVDVRLDFGSLFSSMLASTGDINLDRPTLYSYLDSFRDSKDMTYEKQEAGGGENTFIDDTPVDPSNGVIIPENNDIIERDPDPEITKEIYKDMVEVEGSLTEAINKGLAITESMAKELYKDEVITKSDLLYNFPDVDLSSWSLEFDSDDPTFVIDLTDDELQTVGNDLLMNIKDLSANSSISEETLFDTQKNLLNKVTDISVAANIPIKDVIETEQSMTSAVIDSIEIGDPITINGSSSLMNTMKDMTNSLKLGADSIMDMSSNLINNLKSEIGGILSENQLVEAAGSMLATIGDKLTPDEGFSLLSDLKNTIGDFNLSSGIGLVNTVKSIAKGDIFASLDLVDDIKRLAEGLGIDDNDMLSSSIGIFDGVKKTVDDTGILDNKIVAGGIELFRNNYDRYRSFDLSLNSSSNLITSAIGIADNLNIPGAGVLTTGVDMFDNFKDIQRTIDYADDDLLWTSAKVLKKVQNISSDLNVPESETVKAGINILENMDKVTNDVDTMIYIINS